MSNLNGQFLAFDPITPARKPRPLRNFLISVTISSLVVALAFGGQAAFKALKPKEQWTMAKFMNQHLDWQPCDNGFSCTTFQVPIDYAHPSNGNFSLQVIIHPASGSTTKLGDLFVNPGGPGGSGVDYAYNADTIVSKVIEDNYDIVGFDPRGVNLSQPVRCLTDSQEDAYLDGGGSVANQSDLASAEKQAQNFANTCYQKIGANLGHYSTLESAKDMDILRALLHQPKLNYIGKSYGTYLGTLYAALFPQNTGRMVLDGAVDPNISIAAQNQVQAKSFDTALSSFLKSNTQFTLTEIQGLLAKNRVTPMKTKSARPLTESLTITAIASALYDPASGWPELSAALTQALTKADGSKLLALADSYDQRLPNGHFASNQNDISQITSCLDFPDPRTIDQIQSDAVKYAQIAPVFGPYLAYAGLACHYWAVPPVQPPVLTNLKSAPLLVIGTTRDPATPYAWAQALNKDLVNSTLITLNGDGHTGANRGSACVDDAVNNYLMTGQPPATNLYCAK
jgi:pimeloyl-ACP methyl ester carboxylesterase